MYGIPSESLRRSRWFTREWTLQELVAPANVESFSKEGTYLGDKHSMAQELHSITQISIEALRGHVSLNELSVEERMLWVGQRQTKRAEDAAYCLLGIFNVNILPIYGEGKEKALMRLKKEIAEISRDETSMVLDNAGSMYSSYSGAVFHGPIAGRYVIPGTHVTGGVVNFDFRDS